MPCPPAFGQAQCGDPCRCFEQVVFPQDDAAAAAGEINPASDVPYVFYHNLEQDGALGPTQEVVLTAGDYNSKLVRNFA